MGGREGTKGGNEEGREEKAWRRKGKAEMEEGRRRDGGKVGSVASNTTGEIWWWCP